MIRGLRRHITYANVVSTMALVLALGGGAVYAAGKIGPQEIKRGAIRSYHVKNRQIRRQDIAGGSVNSDKVSNETLKGRDVSDESLTGKDVSDESLTGKQLSDESLTGRNIAESTLGVVPIAQDARTLGGVTLRMVRASQSDGSGPSQVLSQGGLNLALSCPGAAATIDVGGAAPGDAGTVYDTDSGTVQQFDSVTPATVPTVGASNPGIVSVRRPDGTLTRLDFEMLSIADGLGTQDDCFLNGILASGK